MTTTVPFHRRLAALPITVATLAVAFASLPCTVAAQGPRGLAPKPAPGKTWDADERDPSRIVLKFAEGTPVRLRDGRFVGALDLTAVNALLANATVVKRLFQRPETALDADRAALLETVDPALDLPADLNNYYHVHTATRAAGAALIDAFNELRVVEIAFAEHTDKVPCEPGDIPPTTPLYSNRQDYHDPAPTGVDHRAGRVLPGGRGSALQVIDIESSWRLDHEDAPRLVAANVIGAHNQSLNPNHGVAVVGELNAEWDRYGMTGLVDLAGLKVHSHMRQNWASSIDVAAANTPVGSFIVLEVQLRWNSRTVPMEVRQDVFDAVRNAVMAGKHVVAAAGNGSNDLDSSFFQGLFDPNLRDSGSIMVGATDGSSLTRASFSNYGSRVNANGWGRNVATLGYGVLFNPGGDVRQQYTSSFSGTSSATPIVTGAAMALTGAALEQLGMSLSPSMLRSLLEQHGTDVPGGRIGKRPDLVQLLAAIGLPNGLDLQDAGIGETAQLDVAGAPNAAYVVFGALDRGLVDFGSMGRLLLDPNNLFATDLAGLLSASGEATHSIAVPNDDSLRGNALFLQAAFFGSGGFQLTNSVSNFVP